MSVESLEADAKTQPDLPVVKLKAEQGRKLTLADIFGGVVVILLGIILGAVLAFIVGLNLGWITIRC